MAALPAHTIRYYERRGLLPYPLRESNGYRNYGEAAIRRLRFVRAAQAAGLTLDQKLIVIRQRELGCVSDHLRPPGTSTSRLTNEEPPSTPGVLGGS